MTRAGRLVLTAAVALAASALATAQTDHVIHVEFTPPHGAELAKAIATVLGGELLGLESSGFQLAIGPERDLEAVRAFFATLPYGRIVAIDGAAAATAPPTEPVIAQRTLLRVRFADGVEEADRHLLAALYLSRLWPFRNHPASPESWYLLPTPAGIPIERFVDALAASPLVAEIEGGQATGFDPTPRSGEERER